jgi:hypothetical protein
VLAAQTQSRLLARLMFLQAGALTWIRNLWQLT